MAASHFQPRGGLATDEATEAAKLGLYGVIVCMAARRRKEIGVRIAKRTRAISCVTPGRWSRCCRSPRTQRDAPCRSASSAFH
jgi:hypothetical protein